MGGERQRQRQTDRQTDRQTIQHTLLERQRKAERENSSQKELRKGGEQTENRSSLSGVGGGMEVGRGGGGGHRPKGGQVYTVKDRHIDSSMQSAAH